MDTKLEIVLGAPIFGNDPKQQLRAPFGQQKLYQKLRNQARTPKSMMVALCMEYMSIIFALRNMGIDFKIALAHEGLINKDLLREIEKNFKVDIICFPDVDYESVVYIRDFAVSLPNKATLIDSDLERVIKLDNDAKDRKISFSPYGQGGSCLLYTSPSPRDRS